MAIFQDNSVRWYQNVSIPDDIGAKDDEYGGARDWNNLSL